MEFQSRVDPDYNDTWIDRSWNLHELCYINYNICEQISYITGHGHGHDASPELWSARPTKQSCFLACVFWFWYANIQRKNRNSLGKYLLLEASRDFVAGIVKTQTSCRLCLNNQRQLQSAYWKQIMWWIMIYRPLASAMYSADVRWQTTWPNHLKSR